MTLHWKMVAGSAVSMVMALVQIAEGAGADSAHSVLGVAAVVQALLSFGLLGGALGAVYRYGGLNKEVQIMIADQKASKDELKAYVHQAEISQADRSRRIWEKLTDLEKAISHQAGREEVLRELADLPKRRSGG